MTCIVLLLIILQLFQYTNSLIILNKAVNRMTTTAINGGVSLYGSESSRSPLVNWYLIEKEIPFNQKPPRPSNHPFGQIPFLEDDDGVEVFESGAILLYLADKFGGYANAAERAKYTKWVVWANSELDSLCFGKMRMTMLDKDSKALDKLDSILGKSAWLVDNEFSVADVAVASYLNYVPLFFRDCNPSKRPNIVRYMSTTAKRPAFAQAFGQDHANTVITKAEQWLGDKKGIFGF